MIDLGQFLAMILFFEFYTHKVFVGFQLLQDDYIVTSGNSTAPLKDFIIDTPLPIGVQVV